MSSLIMKLFLGALFCLLSTPEAALQDDHWKQKVLYQDTANLTCENSQFDPLRHPEAFYRWLLPSGAIIGHLDRQSYDDRYYFFNNGSTLLIREIKKSDFGIYFCLVTVSSQPPKFKAIKIGVNVDGPYFGDLWQKYQPNLRMGLLAAGVTFVVMGMFCYNHHQFESRNDKPLQQKPSNHLDITIKSVSGQVNKMYTNQAFVSDSHEHEGNDLKITTAVAETNLGSKTKL